MPGSDGAADVGEEGAPRLALITFITSWPKRRGNSCCNASQKEMAERSVGRWIFGEIGKDVQ